MCTASSPGGCSILADAAAGSAPSNACRNPSISCNFSANCRSASCCRCAASSASKISRRAPVLSALSLTPSEVIAIGCGSTGACCPTAPTPLMAYVLTTCASTCNRSERSAELRSRAARSCASSATTSPTRLSSESQRTSHPRPRNSLSSSAHCARRSDASREGTAFSGSRSPACTAQWSSALFRMGVPLASTTSAKYPGAPSSSPMAARSRSSSDRLQPAPPRRSTESNRQ
mmetsp:Transcript_121615/g.242269  ORF Transcript_121615/g.242269 Transcript_121615/m.242269 type:complete len:232 (+) Transcript_121615:163-858(+)